MNQKGYSLLEIVFVMLLISIGSSLLYVSVDFMEQLHFKTLVKQVERGIKSAQYMANMTGREYNVLCTDNAVYIRPGFGTAIYKFQMNQHITIPRDITGRQISFAGKIAPSKGATIEFVHKGLSQKARITIRVATGKTTVYFDKL